MMGKRAGTVRGLTFRAIASLRRLLTARNGAGGPMTLLDRILERGYEMPIDPIIAGRLERHMQRIKPDPLFQRRLRGPGRESLRRHPRGDGGGHQAAPAATPQLQRAGPRHALRLAADRRERHRGRRRRPGQPAGRRRCMASSSSSRPSAWSWRRPTCATTWRRWPWRSGSRRSRLWPRPDAGRRSTQRWRVSNERATALAALTEPAEDGSQRGRGGSA